MAAARAAAAVLDRGLAAWVHYGAAEHHARLVSAHIENEESAFVPADYDEFAEQLSLNSADLEGVRFSAAIDVRPRGVPSPDRALYTLAPLTAAEISEVLAEADQVCNLERAHRGLPRLGEAARAPGGAAAAATPVPAAAPAPGGARLAPAGGAWVLSEPLIGRDVGAEFAPPAGAAALGSWALVVFDGAVASLEMLSEGAEWIDLATRNGIASPVPRADKQRSDSGARPRSSAAHENSIPHCAVHLLATLDGLNVENCAGVELLLRRITMHEEAAAGNPDAPSCEGGDRYLGISDRAGLSTGVATAKAEADPAASARPGLVDGERQQEIGAVAAVGGLGQLFMRDPRELSAPPLREGVDAEGGRGSARGAIHRHLFSTIAWGRPAHAQSDRASFCELAGASVDCETLARAVEPCDPTAVSLPKGQVSPVDVTDIFSPELGRRLDLEPGLADAGVAEHRPRCGPAGAYADVRTQEGKDVEVAFLRCLFECGIFGFSK
ncbi:unnamed protein product, partial [Prorocentrum cordatum]